MKIKEIIFNKTSVVDRIVVSIRYGMISFHNDNKY